MADTVLDEWIYAACRFGQSGSSGYQTYASSCGVSAPEQEELVEVTRFYPAMGENGALVAFGFKRLEASGRLCLFQSSQGGEDDLGRPTYFAQAFLFNEPAEWTPPYFYFESPDFRAPFNRVEAATTSVPDPLPQRRLADLRVGEQFRRFRENPSEWLSEAVSSRPAARLEALAEWSLHRGPADFLLVAEEPADVVVAFAHAWENRVRNGSPDPGREISVCTLQPDCNHTAFSVAGWPRHFGRPAEQFLARFQQIFRWDAAGQQPAVVYRDAPPPPATGSALTRPPLDVSRVTSFSGPHALTQPSPPPPPVAAPVDLPGTLVRSLSRDRAQSDADAQVPRLLELAQRYPESWGAYEQAFLRRIDNLEACAPLYLLRVRAECGYLSDVPDELHRRIALCFERNDQLRAAIARLFAQLSSLEQVAILEHLSPVFRRELVGLANASLDRAAPASREPLPVSAPPPALAVYLPPPVAPMPPAPFLSRATGGGWQWLINLVFFVLLGLLLVLMLARKSRHEGPAIQTPRSTATPATTGNDAPRQNDSDAEREKVERAKAEANRMAENARDMAAKRQAELSRLQNPAKVITPPPLTDNPPAPPDKDGIVKRLMDFKGAGEFTPIPQNQPGVIRTFKEAQDLIEIYKKQFPQESLPLGLEDYIKQGKERSEDAWNTVKGRLEADRASLDDAIARHPNEWIATAMYAARDASQIAGSVMRHEQAADFAALPDKVNDAVRDWVKQTSASILANSRGNPDSFKNARVDLDNLQKEIPENFPDKNALLGDAVLAVNTWPALQRRNYMEALGSIAEVKKAKADSKRVSPVAEAALEAVRKCLPPALFDKGSRFSDTEIRLDEPGSLPYVVTSDLLRKLQEALAKPSGDNPSAPRYYDGKPSGALDDRTQDAILRFQIDQHETPLSGKISWWLLDRLRVTPSPKK